MAELRRTLFVEATTDQSKEPVLSEAWRFAHIVQFPRQHITSVVTLRVGNPAVPQAATVGMKCEGIALDCDPLV